MARNIIFLTFFSIFSAFLLIILQIISAFKNQNFIHYACNFRSWTRSCTLKILLSSSISLILHFLTKIDFFVDFTFISPLKLTTMQLTRGKKNCHKIFVVWFLFLNMLMFFKKYFKRFQWLNFALINKN